MRAPTQALSRFLANNLQLFIGKTSSFIKDSFDFIQKTKILHLEEEDIMVSFDVVSLFTKIPIPEALNLISKLFDHLNIISLHIQFTMEIQKDNSLPFLDVLISLFHMVPSPTKFTEKRHILIGTYMLSLTIIQP
jgi:hypothetical protein